MRLIIEIPDEEYEDVKKTGGCYYDFGKAILYGTPLDNIRAKIKEQIDYHDDEHRKYDSEEEFGISLGLESALKIIDKEVENADVT